MGKVVASLQVKGQIKNYPVQKSCSSNYFDCNESTTTQVKLGSSATMTQLYSNVAEGTRAIGATPGFKMAIVKNTGKVPIEIAEKYPLWTKASADVDNADYHGNWRNHNFNTASENATNADEIDSGYLSRILTPGEFHFIHSQRALIFDGNDSAGINSSFALDNVEMDNSTWTAGDREAGGSAIGHAELNGAHNDSVTTLTIEDDTQDAVTTISNIFKPGDIILVGTELMLVTAVGSTLTVERGYLGSTAASHSDHDDVKFWAMNDLVDYTSYINDGSGVSARVAMTDKNGNFTASNFFGAGRLFFDSASNSNDDNYYTGIQPGSVAIKLYQPAYHDIICSKPIGPSTDSGLTAGSTYYVKAQIDGVSATEVSFVVDSSDTTFGGKDGIINKIQSALNTAANTKGNALYGVFCSVAIVNGNIRFSSNTRNSSDRSKMIITNGTTGGDSGTSWNLFANNSATGIFPTTLRDYVEAQLPKDTIYNSQKAETVTNDAVFLYDNGRGFIRSGAQANGSGSINYETGALVLSGLPPYCELAVSCTYATAHSGGATTSTNSNSLEGIYARSLNSKIDGDVELTIIN